MMMPNTEHPTFPAPKLPTISSNSDNQDIAIVEAGFPDKPGRQT